MSQNIIKPFDANKVNRYRNLCIEASAGTGKTYTVQQIVAKLLQDKEPLSLENILIVTYTEKAAGELKDRIRAILEEKKLTDQLALVDNAPIFTIHSFCKQTLSEFSFEANQTDELELIDESEVKDFIEKWIRDELSKNEVFKTFYRLSNGKTINIDAYAEAIGKYYLDYDGNEVKDIVQLDKTVSDDDEVLRFTDEEVLAIEEYATSKTFDVLHLNYLLNSEEKLNDPASKAPVTNQREIDALEEFKNNLEVLKNEFDKILALGIKHNAKRESGLDLYKSLKNKIDDAIKTKAENCFIGLKKDELPLSADDYFNATDAKKGATPSAKLIACCDYFNNLKTKIKSLSCIDKDAISDKLEEYLFQTQVPEIYKAWNQYKKENKLQSFDDMIRNVRESVCQKESKLKKALQEKYKYAIIDEFQDTNQKQWDIFKRIFMEDKSHAICVVGDPKQSIYAFQGADVTVYSAAVEEIRKTDPDNLPQTLDTNYRSTNKIIEFCNDLFIKREAVVGVDSGNDFFEGNNCVFSPSNCPSIPALIKPNAIYDDEDGEREIEPIWIPVLKDGGKYKDNDEPGAEEEDFAKFAVAQILDCCQMDKNGKTKLQIYKKVDGKPQLCNVEFSDFAVLCKSKSEMKPIKHEFSVSGIPFNRYKEDNLFGGRECRDWIALLNAISVPDFSAKNRKILNECLYSSFFGIPLNQLGSSKFDEPQNPERIEIIKWKKTSLERNWALLLEQIYEDSKVEERLSELDKLGNLTKLRQIGDYCVNYLYKTNCSLNDLIDHLLLLSQAIADADDDGGTLVEKGTDFKAVKIMTIHASKGLEFPIVIAPAGLKGPGNRAKNGVYTYHDNSGKLHICYDKSYKLDGSEDTAGSLLLKESDCEFQRLFYVAYTRASSIMMIHWKSTTSFDCLNIGFNYLNRNDKGKHLRLIPFNLYEYDVDENKAAVKAILNSDSTATSTNDLQEKAAQEEVLKKLSSSVKELDSFKLSYSTLTHGKKHEQIGSEDNGTQERSRESNKKDDNSVFDVENIKVPCLYDISASSQIGKDYPKGALLGEAVHQTFEEADFYRIGNLKEEDAAKDISLCGLIRRKFSGQGIVIDDSDSKQILNQTCKMVWNTLNAVLPEIQGNHETGKTFSLAKLKDDEHFAELEFNMNPQIAQNKNIMQDYFNGFIDLLFVRENSAGEKIYSVLDWKTDSMDVEDYAIQYKIEKHTAERYSIQRVLYSYCLIKWLKQFSNGKDEQWIFENQFGGIYYAYVRGCKAGKGNGIYAQTWENWAALEKAFNNIIDKKVAKGKN